MSQFLVPSKNGLNALLWSCLHITLKRSKVPLTKTVTWIACVSEALVSGKSRLYVSSDCFVVAAGQRGFPGSPW